MPGIRLEGITKRFGDLEAVSNLNLEIKDGEYITLLGPTGAGKTTTLRIIVGLTEQDEGHVYYGDKCIDDLPPGERNTAFLSQTYSLFPTMTVFENTVFGPSVKGMDEETIRTVGNEMLNLVRLTERADAYPHELSGGMQQRNALARALAISSDTLLLDEPLRALDARLRIDLRYYLRKLGKELKITTVHVTHDQEEALVVSDRIAVMRKGRIEQIGTPEEIFENPKNPFIMHFVGEGNFFEGTVVGREDAADGCTADGCTLVETTVKNLDTFYCRKSEHKHGDRVVVGIRPESFVMRKGHDNVEKSMEKADAKNILPGRVKRTHFMGMAKGFDVELDGGKEVLVKMPSSKREEFEVGMEVTLELDPKHALVFEYPREGLENELEVE